MAQQAAALVEDGCVVGLGTGRAAADFIRALADRVRSGLRVRGVPTSKASADLAVNLGIPVVDLHEVEGIDITVDGADEVDPDLNLIKGYGGALVREKIVAAASKQVVILVGSEKVVPVLGTRGTLPVEVIPFALSFCQRQLQKLAIDSTPRESQGGLFTTDNANYILDCRVKEIGDPMKLECSLRSIPGIVDTGLFLGMADTVMIQDSDTVTVRRRNRTV